jgi:hypothetical protein
MIKEQKFLKTLEAAKNALDSIPMSFHLHKGTCLGAHAENAFRKSDDNIDLGVFAPVSKSNLIVKAMEKNGFVVTENLKIDKGYEIKFIYEKYNVSLNILGGPSDFLPYTTNKIMFYGQKYNIVPKSTLKDVYGVDWKNAKKLNIIPVEPKNRKEEIAFCFLLKEYQKHGIVWEKFFKEDKYKSYNIYSHIKNVTDKTQSWLLKNRVKSITTGWCEESLVKAFIQMLEKALENPKNKYFCLLSDECIPLYNYWITYKKITSTNKTRMHIDLTAEAYIDTGFYYADQWVILNRKCAKLLLKLYSTKKGEKYLKYIREETEQFCPDELFPINWFSHNFGTMSSSTFKKEIKNVTVTFTEWDGIHPSPIKFTTPKMQKRKKEICLSDAIFARKFNNKSARAIAESCGKPDIDEDF